MTSDRWKFRCRGENLHFLDSHPSAVAALVLSLEGWIHSSPWLFAFSLPWGTELPTAVIVPEAILNGESLSPLFSKCSLKKIISFHTSKTSAFSNTRRIWIHWFHRLLLFLSFVLSFHSQISVFLFLCLIFHIFTSGLSRQTSLFCGLEGRWTQILSGGSLCSLRNFSLETPFEH